MPKSYNMSEFIGKRYGRWSILSESINKSKDGRKQVYCLCDCGTQKDVILKNIIRGISTSCGCYKSELTSKLFSIDESGNQYGNLTVLSKIGTNEDAKTTWLCKCSCGKTLEVVGKALRNGHKISCPECSILRRAASFMKNYDGERYGRLTVVCRSVSDVKKSTCKCDCGTILDISTCSLVQGLTKSCGCYLRDKAASIEQRVKRSAQKQGIPVTAWTKFKQPATKRLRGSLRYKQWRDAVYARDNYTCQRCGRRSMAGAPCKLNAHHILNFKNHISKRFDVNNGITFCYNCHSQKIKGSFHNLYGTHNNTKRQLTEYLESFHKKNHSV